MKLNVEDLEVGMLIILKIHGTTVIDLILKIDHQDDRINVLSIYFNSCGSFLNNFTIKNGYESDLPHVISFHNPKRNKQ